LLRPLREASELPKGLPRVLNSRMVWAGKQFRSIQEYVLTLGHNDILELEHALERFKGSCMTLTSLTMASSQFGRTWHRWDARISRQLCTSGVGTNAEGAAL
jgi:hypothetical protein